jgi:hypothetical protein
MFALRCGVTCGCVSYMPCVHTVHGYIGIVLFVVALDGRFSGPATMTMCQCARVDDYKPRVYRSNGGLLKL